MRPRYRLLCAPFPLMQLRSEPPPPPLQLRGERQYKKESAAPKNKAHFSLTFLLLFLSLMRGSCCALREVFFFALIAGFVEPHREEGFLVQVKRQVRDQGEEQVFGDHQGEASVAVPCLLRECCCCSSLFFVLGNFMQ